MARKKKKPTARTASRPKKAAEPQLSDFGSKLQAALAAEDLKPTKSTPPVTNKTKRSPNVTTPKTVQKRDPKTQSSNSARSGPKISISAQKSQATTPSNKNVKGRIPKASTLQFHKGDPKEEREIVIGLDFGTSSTKVCFRDVQRNHSYLIDFENFSLFDSASYLLQTTLYYHSKEGVFSIQSGDRTLDELKINLMESPQEVLMEDKKTGVLTASEASCAYLGLVLKLARLMFKRQYGNQFSDVEILWQLNIGIPSRSYDDEELVKSYQMIGLVAWRLSLLEDRFNPNTIRQIWAEEEQVTKEEREPVEGALYPDQVIPIPEIVAGVVGYSHSSIKRKDQLHLLIDIGACTVDIATLYLSDQKSGTDQYSFLTAEVEALGGFQLAKNRLLNFAKVLEKQIQENLDKNDAMTAPPTPESINLSIEKSDADEPLLSEYRKLVADSLVEVKKHRYPRVKHQDNIPLLFTGGGAKISEYEDALRTLNLKPYSVPDLHNLSFESFEELDAPDDVDLSRIGVAYGLSFSPDDIGPILAPHKVPSLGNDSDRARPNTTIENLAYRGASIRYDR